MPMPVDDSGVPVLNREDIEVKAEEVLEYVSPGHLSQVVLSPLLTIIDTFAKEFSVKFLFEEDLGSTSKGKKILGKFFPEQRVVAVDRSLELNEPRWRFTLAHELGHLVLHRKVNVALGPNYYSIFADTVEQIQNASAKPKSAAQWLEWQANSFASSLLMPREPFIEAFQAATAEHPNRRNKQYIYLDDQPQNVAYFREIQAHLKGLFLVSKTAVGIRMKELVLLLDTRPKHIKHAIEFLREE